MRHYNAFVEYLAGRACPERLTNHRKRVLRGSEQSLLRSVHSEFESLAIEPRNKYRWSFRRGVHGNNIPRLIIGQRQQSNRGRQNKADEQSRTCGNLGDSVIECSHELMLHDIVFFNFWTSIRVNFFPELLPTLRCQTQCTNR